MYLNGVISIKKKSIGTYFKFQNIFKPQKYIVGITVHL